MDRRPGRGPRRRGRLLTATDLTATYQWSTNLASWHLSGTTAGGTGVVIVPATLLDNSAPANDLIEVTAPIAAGAPRTLFIRVKATRP